LSLLKLLLNLEKHGGAVLVIVLKAVSDVSLLFEIGQNFSDSGFLVFTGAE